MSRIRSITLVVSIALCSAVVCEPGESGATRAASVDPTVRLQPCIRAAISFYNDRSSDELFPLNREQIHALRDGEVVRILRKVPARSDGDEFEYHERLTAYYLVPQPLESLWAASLDPEFRSSERLTAHLLSGNLAGDGRWYQHLALPWPVRDRHWVIDLEFNTTIGEQVGGAILERSWQLSEEGPALARQAVLDGEIDGIDSGNFDGSVYVPLNRGAWIMIRLDPDWTLICYRVTTSFGGNIPEGMVNTLGAHLVEGLLMGVAEFARNREVAQP